MATARFTDEHVQSCLSSCVAEVSSDTMLTKSFVKFCTTRIFYCFHSGGSIKIDENIG